MWLAGSSCDSDDIYTGLDGVLTLPEYDSNNSDGEPMYIVVYDTGAYQTSLAAQHCVSSPMKIVAENGHIVVARKHESPEDIGKNFGW